MNIEDELNQLKESIPIISESLEHKIYSQYICEKTNKKRRRLVNRFTITLASSMLLIGCIIIGFFSFRGLNTKEIKQLRVKAEGSSLVLDKEYEEFESQYNDFAMLMATEYASYYNENRNTVISPLSIFSSLALAAECSNGNTKEELLEALGINYITLSKNYTKLYQSSTYEVLQKKKITAAEQLSNSIWIDHTFPVKDATLDHLAQDYYCDPFYINFKKSKIASNYISKYIKKQTHNLSDKKFEFSPETTFLLMNCLYLKDTWNFNAKDLELTNELYEFKNYNDTITRKKLLKGNYFSGKVGEGEHFKFFYTQTLHQYKLTFLLPKEGYTPENIFTYDNLNLVKNWEYQELTTASTRCIFPGFYASSDNSLKKLLQEKFNISSIFDPQYCDFSNLTESPAYCRDLNHASIFNVNEKGIEGAAVTIILGDASAPPPIKEYDFIINRDFGFIVQDPRGNIIFSGIIDSI